MDEALQLVRGEFAAYEAKRQRIEADRAKRVAEQQSTEEQVRKLEQTLPLARQRAEDLKNLVDKKFVSKHQYLESEQERIEQEADLATARSKLKEIAAALREVQAQQGELLAETRRVNLERINEGLSKMASFEQELIKATTRGQLMKVVAPVDGTVQQLAIHTVGGVVTPAQALMVLVPSDRSLDLEVFVENKDIGFVKEGQEAEVKIETFQFTKYGTIHGQVMSVSHDAINDEQRGLVYAARVKLARNTMQVEGTEVNLSPGMAVSVEIKTGKRRIIEYFLSPLLQHADESLRER